MYRISKKQISILLVFVFITMALKAGYDADSLRNISINSSGRISESDNCILNSNSGQSLSGKSTLSSGGSNWELGVGYYFGLGDLQPPASITDLSAEAGEYEGEINLTWTAVGDDDNEKDNSGGNYILKYSTIGSIPSVVSWIEAAEYSQSWMVKSISETESKTIVNLTGGVTYWFAIKSEDKYGNMSAVDITVVRANSFAQASSPAPVVVINEIAWMGTASSTYDEWIELYNNTSSTISLSGWTLSSSDSNPDITLSGNIMPKGYFLLEDTDDNTVSDINADQIYNQALGNTGENLSLKNSAAETIDSVDCSGGWFAGDNTSKISMERINTYLDGSMSSSWADNDEVTVNGLDASSNPLKATPRAVNSVYDVTAPAAVTTLSAYPAIGAGEVVLNWIAPGNNGTSGTASTYILKYGSYTINSENWDTCNEYQQDWTPQSSGSSEWHTVTGLSAETSYYFAIKSADIVENTSDVSNSCSSVSQSTNALVINEIAPSETGGYDIIEMYVKSEASLASATIYENANAQGSELAKTFPSTGDWANTFEAGTYVVIRFNNTTPDESAIGGDGVINVYTTDSGLSSTDNLVFLSNSEGLEFSGGAYQSGNILDFVAFANQDTTPLTDDYKAGINLAVANSQWSISFSTPVQLDCVNSRGCYTVDKSIGRDQYSTDTNVKADWSYRTYSSIGSVNSPPTTYQGQGSAEISPSATVLINSTGSWSITYTAADPNNDNTNHVVTIDIPDGWSAPQSDDQYSAGYATTSYSFAGGYSLLVASDTIILPVGNMTDGETITVDYNNSEVQSWASTATFKVSSDEVGSNVGELASGSPMINVSDDSTAPSAITDLLASVGTSEGTVDLTWTAVGDDENTGKAESYDVRYSSIGVIDTDVKFNAALTYINSWDPLSAGQEESHSVSVLYPGTTCWFAIKVADELPNISALSNSPSTTTFNSSPSAPTGLAADAAYQTIGLSWADNSEPDIQGYNVYRSTVTGTDYAKLTSTLNVLNIYQDSGLTTGTTYYYVVTAVDNTDLESVYSSEISACPPDIALPDGNVVISEIMYDPTGTEPDGEWVELYNRSTSIVDISSCTLTDGEGTFIVPEDTYIDVDGYFVLGNSASAAEGNYDLLYGTSTSGTLSLANSGDSVIFKNKYDVEIDSVTFTEDWGATGSSDLTLQRKYLDQTAFFQGDWGQSFDENGTPGYENNTDTTSPSIEHTPITAAYAGRSLHIQADAIDDNYWYSGNVKVFYKVTGSTGSYSEIKMSGIYDEYSGIIPSSAVTTSGVDYYLWAMDDYNNTITDPETDAETSPHQVSVTQCPFAVIVNEIMYDPADDPEQDYEWVEIYNDTSTSVDISGWTFSDINDSYTIPEDTIMSSYSYLVLGYSTSAANGNVDLVYGLDPYGEDITFNNALAGVSDSVIIRDTNTIIVDEVPYAAAWGASNQVGPHNNTLERLRASDPSEEETNWLHSNAKGGTPGEKNSSHMIRNVDIAPEIFNPVRGSTSAVTYDLVWEDDMENSTTTVHVKIYNSSGTLVRTYTDTKSSSGTYTQTWDGKNETSDIVLGLNTVEIVGVNVGASETITCTHSSDDRIWFDYGAILGLMGPNYDFSRGEISMYFTPLSKPVFMNAKAVTGPTLDTVVRNIMLATLRTETTLILWDHRDEFGRLMDVSEYDSIHNTFAEKPEGHVIATKNTTYLYDVYVSSRCAFNPLDSETAKIYYSLSAESAVTVDVYNEDSAQFIGTILDTTKTAGDHVLEWSGKDAGENEYPDGIYCISINCGSQRITKDVSIRSY